MGGTHSISEDSLLLTSELGQLMQQGMGFGEFGLAPWEALALWEAVGTLPPAPEARTPSLSSSAVVGNDYHSLLHTTKLAPTAPAHQPAHPTSQSSQPGVNSKMESSHETIQAAMSENAPMPPVPTPTMGHMVDDAEDGGLPSFQELVAFWEAKAALTPAAQAAVAPSSSPPADDDPINTDVGPSSSAPPQPRSPAPSAVNNETEITELTMKTVLPPTTETPAPVTPSPTNHAMASPKPGPATGDHLALQSTATRLAPATPEQQSPRRAAPETPAKPQPSSRVMTFTQDLLGRCVAFLAAAGGRGPAGMGIVVGMVSAPPSPSATASKAAKRSGC